MNLIERLRKAAYIQWQHTESVDLSGIMEQQAADEIERYRQALDEICAEYFKGNDADCADAMYNIAVKVTDDTQQEPPEIIEGTRDALDRLSVDGGQCSHADVTVRPYLNNGEETVCVKCGDILKIIIPTDSGQKPCQLDHSNSSWCPCGWLKDEQPTD